MGIIMAGVGNEIGFNDIVGDIPVFFQVFVFLLFFK